MACRSPRMGTALSGHRANWAGNIMFRASELARPVGAAEGPFAESSMAGLVLHISREAIHHGAEICLLRDLYLREGD